MGKREIKALIWDGFSNREENPHMSFRRLVRISGLKQKPILDGYRRALILNEVFRSKNCRIVFRGPTLTKEILVEPKIKASSMLFSAEKINYLTLPPINELDSEMVEIDCSGYLTHSSASDSSEHPNQQRCFLALPSQATYKDLPRF